MKCPKCGIEGFAVTIDADSLARARFKLSYESGVYIVTCTKCGAEFPQP